MKKLTVYDVGHGNWNELNNDEIRVFYDVGAGKYLGEQDIQAIIDKVEFQSSHKIIVVISHWDVDHYQCILKMSNDELEKIKQVIAPEPPRDPLNQELPNTIKKAITKLEEHNIPVNYIKRSKKLNYKSSEIELNPFTSSLFSKSIQLYRTTGSRNKNLDSIVLYCKGQNLNALLTGDNYYNKLYKYIMVKRKGKNILVVPHHGGEAGKFNKTDWSKIQFETIVCSWGENKYKHTLKKTENNFNGIVKSKSIHDTKNMGTKSYDI